MLSYFARRAWETVLTLIGVSIVAFMLVNLSGDPARLIASPDATAAEIDAIRERLRLDRPLPVQYAEYMSRLARLDLGNSLTTGHPNAQLIAIRLPATLQLAFVTLVLMVVLAVPTGIVSAIWRGTVFDAAVRSVIIVGQAAPVFWVAIMLILLFSIEWRVLPSSGFDSWRSLVLPAFALATNSAAELARFTRSAMLDVMNEDYVRTARAKGLPTRDVLLRHALRNALIPVITVIGLRFGALLGGAIVTEVIFAWPGLGTLTVQAVRQRDVSLVQSVMLFSAFFVVFTSLLVDVLYTFVDPRIRYL